MKNPQIIKMKMMIVEESDNENENLNMRNMTMKLMMVIGSPRITTLKMTIVMSMIMKWEPQKVTLLTF